MVSDVSYFTQDYWMNSLAIGHPLVYQSQANSEISMGPALDDCHVMQWNTMDMAKYDSNV